MVDGKGRNRKFSAIACAASAAPLSKPKKQSAADRPRACCDRGRPQKRLVKHPIRVYVSGQDLLISRVGLYRSAIYISFFNLAGSVGRARLRADLARFREARHIKQMQNAASELERGRPGDVHTYGILYGAPPRSLTGPNSARLDPRTSGGWRKKALQKGRAQTAATGEPLGRFR